MMKGRSEGEYRRKTAPEIDKKRHSMGTVVLRNEGED
jgi:hypothetical protein